MRTKITLLSGFLMFSLFCFQACAQKKEEKKEPRNITPQYTGEIDQQDLLQSPYTSRWYNAVYDSFDPQTEKEAVDKINANIKDYDILVFLGTWCPDSKRDVPKLYKILEQADYNMDNLTMYTLNQAKRSQTQEEKDWRITNVPTIIFLKNGEEVNRYVERPRENLVLDIAKIVSGAPYKNIYTR